MDGNVRAIQVAREQGGDALLRELGAETTVRLSDGREMLNDVSNRSVSPIFVGRQYELARLRSAFVRSVAGEPQTVLIGGEAGIGKSRLVEEFTSRLDATVAVGTCIE